ncbi:MAG: polymer-forming cytoskeletal protein [Bacteroidales bacterium]|nr:polymer-forming cytoskeletal protein [Bacteroidales bacterium]
MAKNFESEQTSPNLILKGTEIKGDIISNNDIRFDGTLTGNLQTKGKLVIGVTGHIKGEVRCKHAEIEGKVEGKVFIEDLLKLKATSLIEGDITTKKLAIEAGARFTGSCSMNGETPVLNATRTEQAKVK